MKADDLNVQRGIISLLRDQYGLAARELTFIPIGEASYAYKVVADNGYAYFVKYIEKRDTVESVDAVNALLLQLRDLDFVVPPILARDKTPVALGHGRVIVFPFIEGKVIERGNETFEKELVDEMTRMMAQIHILGDRAKIALPIENFSNDYRDQLMGLKAQIQKASSLVRVVFEENEILIESMIGEQQSEALRYRRGTVDRVVTHGDMTGRNIIQSPYGLKLVDWDEAMFAPAERDINFLYENQGFSLDDYYAQMGSDKRLFDPTLREYYRRQWAIESILENLQKLVRGVADDNQQEYFDEIADYLSQYRHS